MAEISPVTLADGSMAQTLRLRVDHAIRGVQLTRSAIQSGRLTALHEREEERGLYRKLSGRSILTRDNPLLDAAALENLDAQGLIRPGIVIGEETILASILRTLEIDVGRPPPRTGMVRAQDDSLKTPLGWAGAVVAAARYECQSPIGVQRPKKQIDQIAVQLQLAMPIGVGDVMLLRDHAFAIAGVSESTDTDIVADASVGRLLELSHGQSAEVSVSVRSQPARWAMAARSTGPYSLITGRPLNLASNAGQPVTPAHVCTLSASGMTANLAELVTIKSDDVVVRKRLRSAL